MAKISFKDKAPSLAPAKPTAPATAPAPATQPAPVVQPAPVNTTPTAGTAAAGPAPGATAAAVEVPPSSHAEQVAQGAPGALPIASDVPSAAEGTAEYDSPPPPAFYDGDEGAFDPGDLVLPRLNIVQKVGDLSNVFPPGTIVLGAQLVLTEAPVQLAVSKPIRIVLLGLQPTTFSEKLEGGARGNYFRTEKEVVDAGGTLDWNEAQVTEKQLYQRVSLGLVAVEQAAGVDGSMFPHTLDGKNYALALYTMKGTSYTNAARHFKSARKIGHLRTTGYRFGNWLLASQLKKYGSNFSYIPVVKPADATTEAFRDQLKALLGF